MNVAFTCLDKWARHGKSDVCNSNKYCYMNNCWYHIWQAMQMTKHTLMHEILLGCEVATVVDMMRTVITIGSSGSAFRLRVVVEGYGEHHWHVHQHQQPRKPHSSFVVLTHYPEFFTPREQGLYNIKALLLEFGSKVLLFFENTNISLKKYTFFSKYKC